MPHNSPVRLVYVPNTHRYIVYDRHREDLKIGTNEGINDRLSRIEHKLGITPRNAKMEMEFPQLEKLGERYADNFDLHDQYARMLKNCMSYKKVKEI